MYVYKYIECVFIFKLVHYQIIVNQTGIKLLKKTQLLNRSPLTKTLPEKYDKIG